MRVLVTDGDNRATLAIVRSLGRRGHHVIVGERRTPSLAQASRYCAERVVYPDPFTNEIGFTNQLLKEIVSRSVDVLLPVADVTTALVAQRRDDFRRECLLPLADEAAIARAADKVDVLKLAMRLGVPVPRTWFVEHAGEAAALALSLPYPIVVKPRRSRVRTDRGWRSCSVTYAGDAAQLMGLVHGWPSEACPLILQERISGEGTGVFLCLDRGKPIAVFGHRRLREKPPSGGVSVLCESVNVSEDMLAQASSLLSDIGWQGVAMVEFKKDDRDGTPKLMEINGRFWGSLQLAIDAGVDFPSILLDMLTGNSPATMPTYRTGVQSRWLWGDVDALLLRLFGRQQRAAGVSNDKLRHLLRFLKMWSPNLHYENPRLSDLRPWVFETGQWFLGWRSARAHESAVGAKVRE